MEETIDRDGVRHCNHVHGNLGRMAHLLGEVDMGVDNGRHS